MLLLRNSANTVFLLLMRATCSNIFISKCKLKISIYFSLFPTWYTVFPSTYNICYPLSSTCFRPHRPIIRRSKLYMQPMVFSPSADVSVVRPLRKQVTVLLVCRLGLRPTYWVVVLSWEGQSVSSKKTELHRLECHILLWLRIPNRRI